MNDITDFQVGKAGEYLVCADLILKGHTAFLSEQGLSFDVVLMVSNRLYRVQVKTTRQPSPVPQRLNRTDKYTFNVRRFKKNKSSLYRKEDADIVALVALDTKTIGYVDYKEAKQTMFCLPEDGYVANGNRLSSRKLSELKIEGLL